MGVRFPAGMCSALCTKVSWSLGWGCPPAELAEATAPEEVELFEILPVEGAAWLGRCQLGDLITLVDPRGLKAAAVVSPATPGLAKAGLTGLSGIGCADAADGAKCGEGSWVLFAFFVLSVSASFICSVPVIWARIRKERD